MTELEDLLFRAGHRPAKRGKRWICGNCGPGHTPSLSVDAEVFFCFRCQLSGNVWTLKKELRIPVVVDRRAQRLQAEVEFEKDLMLKWFSRLVADKNRQYRDLYGRLLELTDAHLSSEDRLGEIIDCERELEVIGNALDLLLSMKAEEILDLYLTCLKQDQRIDAELMSSRISPNGENNHVER